MPLKAKHHATTITINDNRSSSKGFEKFSAYSNGFDKFTRGYRQQASH